MCGCPAHRELVDCTGCPCDHAYDRMAQWKRRALSAEAWQARARKLATDQHLKHTLTGECITTCQGCYLERFLVAVDPMVPSP